MFAKLLIKTRRPSHKKIISVSRDSNLNLPKAKYTEPQSNLTINSQVPISEPEFVQISSRKSWVSFLFTITKIYLVESTKFHSWINMGNHSANGTFCWLTMSCLFLQKPKRAPHKIPTSRRPFLKWCWRWNFKPFERLIQEVFLISPYPNSI